VAVKMRTLTTVDALLVTCLLVTASHCASLSAVNLGRDAWLEDFENIARQVCTRDERLVCCRETARRYVSAECLLNVVQAII